MKRKFICLAAAAVIAATATTTAYGAYSIPADSNVTAPGTAATAAADVGTGAPATGTTAPGTTSAATLPGTTGTAALPGTAATLPGTANNTVNNAATPDNDTTVTTPNNAPATPDTSTPGEIRRRNRTNRRRRANTNADQALTESIVSVADADNLDNIIGNSLPVDERGRGILDSKTYIVQNGDDLWIVSGKFKAKLDALIYSDENDETLNTGNTLYSNADNSQVIPVIENY